MEKKGFLFNFYLSIPLTNIVGQLFSVYLCESNTFIDEIQSSG